MLLFLFFNISIIILILTIRSSKKALKLCCSIRENVSFISSSIAEVRSFNTCEFSAELAKAAKFCTEQFLNEAFNLISEIPSTRRSLTRYELLQIISIWMIFKKQWTRAYPTNQISLNQ